MKRKILSSGALLVISFLFLSANPDEMYLNKDYGELIDLCKSNVIA